MDSTVKNLLKDRIPEIQIDLKTVKRGTKISFDLYDEYGNIIINDNTPLTDPLLKHVIANGNDFLYYNPSNSIEASNIGELDLKKKIIEDNHQEESIALAKDILDSIKKTIDFSPKSLTSEKIENTRSHVDNILKEVENNSDGFFTPFVTLKNLDEYTYVHSSNVSILAALLGAKLEYNRAVRVKMGVGGLFHDIGKANIDINIINKFGNLSPEELIKFQKHPIYGFKLVEQNPDLSSLEKSIILYHHERPDGNGYPLKYDYNNYTGNVPKEVRLISICDVYSSLILNNSFSESYTPQKAMRIIVNSVHAPFKKKSQFLPGDVRDFVRSLGFVLNKGNYFFYKGETVRLSSGELAIVENMNRLYPLNPKVKVITNKHLKTLNRPVSVDLLRDTSIYIAHIFDKSTKVS